MNDCSFALVVCPCSSYFFKFYFFFGELSFLLIDLWIELLKPGVSENDVILTQVGDIESLGVLLLSPSYVEDT
jgi:hypothetical protein